MPEKILPSESPRIQVVDVGGELEPRVDSRWLAERLGVKHHAMTQLLKKYATEISELGLFSFEMRKVGSMGRPEMFAFLNEDQCYFVLTLSRNTEKVVALKLLLTKEFRRLREDEKKKAFAARRQARKEWQKERATAAVEYRLMSMTLKEKRDFEGKQTQPYHYANEAKLVNWAMTGKYGKVDRESLSREDLGILIGLEVCNTFLLGLGLDRQARKERLKERYQLSLLEIAGFGAGNSLTSLQKL